MSKQSRRSQLTKPQPPLSDRPADRRGEPRSQSRAYLLSLALALCEEAIAPIRGVPKHPEPIHRSRVAIKKLRALLLLLRPDLAPRTFDSLRANLRKAAQALSQIRDIDSLLESVSLLVRRGALSRKMLFPLQEALSAPGAKGRPRKQPTLSKARRSLRSVRRSLQESPVHPLDKGRIEKGLRRTLRKARLLFGNYQSNQSSKTFHAWRKLTKRLAYQLRLTTLLRTSRGQKFIRRAEKIGELTGQERDLELLAEALRAAPKSRPRTLALRAIQGILPLIHQKAIASGRAFFQRSKKRFFQITGPDE